MWKSTVPTTMQGFGDYCKNMVQDNGSNGNSISITLRDTRDDNTYTVAKLKDGKCWMTQNLRIIGEITITPEDSDVKNQFKLPRNSSAGFYMNASNSSKNYLWPNTLDEYGAYYTWFTATAGEGTDALLSKPNVEVGSSVCAKGWRLPSYNEVTRLISLYSTQQAMSAPFKFILSGQFRRTGLEYGGLIGAYWESTTSNASDLRPYSFKINNNTWENGVGLIRDEGGAIRCINK